MIARVVLLGMIMLVHSGIDGGGGVVMDSFFEKELKLRRASERMDEDANIYCIVIEIDGKPIIIWE